MAYTIVRDYYRKQNFDFFSRYANPFYGVSFQLDISHAKLFAADHGYPVYLTLCYLMTRAAQDLEDFQYRVVDSEIVRYDRLDLSATLPAPGRLFSFAYFEYHPDIATFHRQAEDVAQQARKGADLSEREHRNQLLFTALPTVAFTAFTHPTRADRTDARPNTALGRFQTSGDRTVMPVGLEVNHIFIDGNALGELVERFQKVLDDPEEAQPAQSGGD